jgi:hypothetical protein
MTYYNAENAGREYLKIKKAVTILFVYVELIYAGYALNIMRVKNNVSNILQISIRAYPDHLNDRFTHLLSLSQ